ncbi:MAG: NAD(P)/FAD-dependent oxidoreductase [Bacteroidales bacterium]|jgi:phytoene dehydrogenase-like protein|nr:NAD(P)/FAD-dependent oxidoreductase [Bacteroidales bacterium]
MENFDVVIIGSGLGGLECGVMLSKEGYKVCVLEKHHIAGGCLQSFKRKGISLDTGIHYVGSLSDGQVFNQYLKYFGVLDKLRIKKMDENAFDVIYFEDRQYNYSMGIENFENSLLEKFPNEKDGLNKYCKSLQDIYSSISVENLKNGLLSSGSLNTFSLSAYETIANTVKDRTLQNVLVGTLGLYAGDKHTTNFYNHAMIHYSNIDGAYRFVNSTQQWADILVEQIRSNGGEVLTRKEVTSIEVKDNIVESIMLKTGEKIFAKYVISSIHPANTFDLVEKNPLIKKAYLTRLHSLQNSCGMFTVYLIYKKENFPYINQNHYIYTTNDIWDNFKQTCNGKVASVLVVMQATENSDYNVVTLLFPVSLAQLGPWINTVSGNRGSSYEEFKEEKKNEAIAIAKQYLPKLSENIEFYYTASPLTYRDYTGTPDGSAYGIVKDYHSPFTTLMPVKTRLANLLLTGQNVNVHGALGVTLTAAHTCAELLGKEFLAKKIWSA